MSNNHRLPYQIHTNSCSSNPPTTPPLLRGGDSCYGQRDQVLARQKGDSQNPSVRKRTRICKFPVHGSQERWGSKACHKFESPEQFCRVFSFQNGRDTHAERPFKKRRLHGQIRPQGCLFYRSSVGKPSKVSEISVEGHNVGICLPSLWPSQCTESLHQTHETSGGDVAQNGRKTNSLPRRHFDNGRKQTTCKSTCAVSSQYTGKSRLCGELREVSDDSFPSDRIPRFPSGFNNYDSSITLRESSQDPAGVPKGANSVFPDIAKVGKLDRFAKQFHSSSSSLPPFSKLKESASIPFNELRKRGAAIPTGSRGTAMVERQLDGLEWQGLGEWGPRSNNRDRCFPSRMGSCLQWDMYRRPLDTIQKTSPHQLPGVDGRCFRSEGLHSTQNSSEGSLAHGQCNSSDIYQQNGGHQVPHSVKSCLRTVVLVPSTPKQSNGTSYSRDPKPPGRPGVTYCCRPLRLETETGNFPMHSETLGSPGNRPLCIPPIVPDPKVRKLEARSRGRNSGCFYPRLGSVDGVCLSPFRISREMPKTSHSPTSSEIGHSSPSMGNPALAPTAPPTLCRLPSVISTACRSVDQAGGKSPPNPPSVSRMACLNRSYSETGISAEARTLLMAAWRKNTSSAYGAAWQKWASWCNQQQVNPLSAPLSAVLDFLTREFNSGKAYRSINVYRSAISMTHPTIDSLRFGEHPLVCQLMKGIFNKRPPLPRYTQTWKVHQVTSYLEGLGDNSELSLKQLSGKLVVLLALTSAERGSELAAHDLRFRRFYPEGVSFTLPQLTKKSCVGNPTKTSFHASLPCNARLCPIECLREYEKRTEAFQPNASNANVSNKLFVSYIRPHRPVSSSTLARWMKETLGAAKVDTSIFKPTHHGVRQPLLQLKQVYLYLKF